MARHLNTMRLPAMIPEDDVADDDVAEAAVVDENVPPPSAAEVRAADAALKTLEAALGKPPGKPPPPVRRPEPRRRAASAPSRAPRRVGTKAGSLRRRGDAVHGSWADAALSRSRVPRGRSASWPRSNPPLRTGCTT